MTSSMATDAGSRHMVHLRVQDGRIDAPAPTIHCTWNTLRQWSTMRFCVAPSSRLAPATAEIWLLEGAYAGAFGPRRVPRDAGQLLDRGLTPRSSAS